MNFGPRDTVSLLSYNMLPRAADGTFKEYLVWPLLLTVEESGAQRVEVTFLISYEED